MAGPLKLERRFRVAYLSLATLFGVAVGSFIVLEKRPAPKPPPPWSAWKPTASDIGQRQQQIAEHIAVQYRLPSGKKLVDVLAGGPGPASNPIQRIAIARTLNPQQQSDLITAFDTSGTAMFIMCGDGPKCSIDQGPPTKARGLVLGREALELALYTLRYISDANSVVTFFPPAKGKNMAYVLLFTKAELTKELHAPLRKTLPQAKPPVPGKLTPVERKTVDTLTGPRVFRFRVAQGSGGARVLVLVPNRG